MLTTYPQGSAVDAAVWIDCDEPTEDERNLVLQATGVQVATREALSEIESTSRAYTRGDALYFSTSLAIGQAGESRLTPLGFTLAPKVLVTVRFAELMSYGGVTTALAQNPPASKAPAEDIFLRILETIIDRGADHLEALASELTTTSRRTFAAEASPRKTGDELKDSLNELGAIADNMSQLRDSLHGIARVVSALGERHKDHLTTEGQARIPPMALDLKSLDEYREQLWTKVQFTLDATLGFVNIEQNDIVKALTVVSTVGVPPVLIAGIYGMNFQHMPELSWRFGYPFALGLIVVSTLVPLGWLKSRHWI